MSNLIIAIIAVALSILVFASSLMLMDRAATDNGAKAMSAKMQNQAQQIAGAITIYKGDGNFITEDFQLTELTDKYLVDVPSTAWKAEAKHIYRTDVTFEACALSNDHMNMHWAKTESDVYVDPQYPDTAIPYCTKLGISNLTPCCYTPDEEGRASAPAA